jgi:hypothetical protein
MKQCCEMSYKSGVISKHPGKLGKSKKIVAFSSKIRYSILAIYYILYNNILGIQILVLRLQK